MLSLLLTLTCLYVTETSAAIAKRLLESITAVFAISGCPWYVQHENEGTRDFPVSFWFVSQRSLDRLLLFTLIRPVQKAVSLRPVWLLSGWWGRGLSSLRGMLHVHLRQCL